MTDYVVLVDESDNDIGVMEKMEAHVSASLHRAISVFIFNTAGEMLLQKRAKSKYHSGGLWTNTCCSHPRPDESPSDSASRRLMEEMGLTCQLKPAFTFIYKCELDNSLFEHELDHVFTGVSDSPPTLNPEEAEDFKFINLEQLQQEVELYPELFTVWFRIALPQLIARIK